MQNLIKLYMIKNIALFIILPVLGLFIMNFAFIKIMSSGIIPPPENGDETTIQFYLLFKIPIIIWLISLIPSFIAIFMKSGAIKTIFRWSCIISPLIYWVAIVIFIKSGFIL